MDAPSSLLDEREQEFLLEVARTTIMEYVTNQRVPRFKTDYPRLEDKRGAFVTLHERSGALRGCIGYLDLEISVLTPLEEIREVEEICVGKHGLMIKKGFFSGLLLPQVATEFGWDQRQFLRETCRKAGLDADAWKTSDAKIYIFSAQVFGRSLL